MILGMGKGEGVVKRVSKYKKNSIEISKSNIILSNLLNPLLFTVIVY
jgi:hypothetical protein